MLCLPANATLGVLADTHGLLRPDVLAALAGVQAIVHAGDLDTPEVLRALRQVAPVVAVRGNCDDGGWARELPVHAELTLGEHRLLVIHRLEDLGINPLRAGFAAVVFGHTHQPLADFDGHLLYLNPGSAGPRRFRLPVAMTTLAVVAGQLVPRTLTLPDCVPLPRDLHATPC